LPDDDVRLPFDEKRFGSDASRRDMDGDGLNDLEEFSAGVYASSNPLQADTDGDCISDDRALSVGCYDRVAALYSWTRRRCFSFFSMVARNDGSGPIAVFGGWNEAGLYFWFVAPRKMPLIMALDGSADNGFWKGGDTYNLKFSQDSVWFNGLGLEGKVRGSGGRIMPGPHGEYMLHIALPVQLGQGVS
jgi:hypothetical protein